MAHFGAGPSCCSDPLAAAAIRAWNMMDGKIDWAGLPVVSQVVGIDDIEILAAQLEMIRAHMRTDGN